LEISTTPSPRSRTSRFSRRKKPAKSVLISVSSAAGGVISQSKIPDSAMPV
jgi:hypothetical protein